MIEFTKAVYLWLYVEAVRCKNLPRDVLASGGYVYPVLGIHYFFTHPDLWAFYAAICIPQLIITLIVYIVFYILLYPLVATLFVVMTGPIGIFFAWWFIFGQAALASSFIVSYVLMPEIQRIAFDSILSRESADSVVLIGKLRRIAKVPFYIKCGKLFWAIPDILVLPYTIFKGILLTLIDAIPIFGWYIVTIIQAPSRALQSHARYFTLKGYDNRQVLAIYKANTGAYLGYGLVANALEHIPIFNVFFMFTNTIGSSIWAVRIERDHAILGIDTLKFLDLPKAQEFINLDDMKEMNSSELRELQSTGLRKIKSIELKEYNESKNSKSSETKGMKSNEKLD